MSADHSPHTANEMLQAMDSMYADLGEEVAEKQKRKTLDILADEYGGKTRAERRAFKSRLKRLMRQEARSVLRRKRQSKNS